MTISNNLKKIIKNKGLSKYEIAKISGLPASTIQYIVSGKTEKPRIDILQKLAKALDVSIAELTGEMSATDSATGTDTMQVEKFSTIDHQLLAAFRRLSDTNKKKLVELLEALTEKSRPESEKKEESFFPFDDPGSKKKNELLTIL